MVPKTNSAAKIAPHRTDLSRFMPWIIPFRTVGLSADCQPQLSGRSSFSCFLTDSHTPPDIWAGLQALWQPQVILSVQAFWLVVFWYHGKSMVTDSEIVIRVREDRLGF